MMEQITILGRPISKKNSKQLIHRNGRMIPICSRAFNNFREEALAQLVGIRKLKPPYAVSYRFNMKGKLDTDIDNMVSGINDILQDAGIITDDKYITHINAIKISGCKEWESHITIC